MVRREAEETMERRLFAAPKHKATTLLLRNLKIVGKGMEEGGQRERGENGWEQIMHEQAKRPTDKRMERI